MRVLAEQLFVSLQGAGIRDAGLFPDAAGQTHWPIAAAIPTEELNPAANKSATSTRLVSSALATFLHPSLT